MSASQLPRASEVMDLRKESMTATLLNQHNSLLQFLDTQVSLATTPIFSSQKIITKHKAENNG